MHFALQLDGDAPASAGPNTGRSPVRERFAEYRIPGRFMRRPSVFAEQAARAVGELTGSARSPRRSCITAGDVRARDAASDWTAQHRLLDAAAGNAGALQGGAWCFAGERRAVAAP